MQNRKPPGARSYGGLFVEIQVRARLILRLMLDWRVNIFYKLIPIGAVIYVLVPYNIPGPFDDLAVFLFGMYIFVELCPQEIVKQHLDHIHGITDPPPDQDDDIIDAEFRILDENEQPGKTAEKTK